MHSHYLIKQARKARSRRARMRFINDLPGIALTIAGCFVIIALLGFVTQRDCKYQPHRIHPAICNIVLR